MKTSKAFKIVLEKLLDDVKHYNNAYICLAIQDCANYGYFNYNTAQKLKEILADRMQVSSDKISGYSLYNWMEENTSNFEIILNEQGENFVRKKLNQTRVLWVKSLIKEYKVKGD